MPGARCWYPVRGASARCAVSGAGARCWCWCGCPVLVRVPGVHCSGPGPLPVPVCGARCRALVPVPVPVLGAAVGDAEGPPRPPPRPPRPGAAPAPAAAISANPRRGPAVPIGSRRSRTAPGAAAMVRPARTWDRPGPCCPAPPRSVARARSRSPLPSVKVTVRGAERTGAAGAAAERGGATGGGAAPARPRQAAAPEEAGGPRAPHRGIREGSARERHPRVPSSCAPPTGVRAWAAGAALAWLRAEHRSLALGRSPGSGAGGTASLAGSSAGTVTRV